MPTAHITISELTFRRLVLGEAVTLWSGDLMVRVIMEDFGLEKAGEALVVAMESEQRRWHARAGTDAFPEESSGQRGKPASSIWSPTFPTDDPDTDSKPPS